MALPFLLQISTHNHHFPDQIAIEDLWGMPCKTYDLSVKVRPWEFGSSPM